MADASALLLDLDGTLVDTADANYAAYAAALADIGVAIDRAAFDRVATGRHWRQFLPLLVAGTSADPAAIAARKQQIYPTLAAQTRLIAPILALAEAACATLKTALVTSASRPSASAVIAAHGLARLFDTVVTGDDVAHPKPAPDPYLLAAARLGVVPARCLVIEDSDTGVESAWRAGMTVLRVDGLVSG